MKKVIICNNAKHLYEPLSNKLNLIDSKTNVFKDGELSVKINESIEDDKIIIIQSLIGNVENALIEVLLYVDSVKRLKACDVEIFITYLSYARQDRITDNASCLSAKVIADILSSNNIISNIKAIDVHSAQIQGFFNIPFINITIDNKIIEDIRQHDKEFVIIAPDFGGITRARNIAQELAIDIAIIEKKRNCPNQSKAIQIIGDVANKHCIIIDDIIDGGGTLCNASNILMDHSASSVVAYITHGLFSNNAIQNIQSSAITELVVSNSINISDRIQNVKKIRSLDISQCIINAL